MVLIGTFEDLSHKIIVRFVAAELAILVAIGFREGVFARGRCIRSSAIIGRLTGSHCSQNECNYSGVEEFRRHRAFVLIIIGGARPQADVHSVYVVPVCTNNPNYIGLRAYGMGNLGSQEIPEARRQNVSRQLLFLRHTRVCLRVRPL